MKVSSIFKYIFIIFAIGIIIYAGYIIYNNQIANASENTQEVVNAEENIIKDLRLAVTDFDTINPLITNNKEILNIDTLIFEPLFALNENYELIPCLATECSKTGDNTYVVKLDNTIKWTNGLSLDADDVKFTIETIKNGNSVYKYNVEHISNIEIIDNGTIKLTLDANIPFFEYYLIFPILSSTQYNGEDFYASQQVPIGTGRYQISNVSTNSITLTYNQNWKNPKNEDIKIENIRINIYSSMGEAYNSFKIGNIDFLNTSNPNFQEYIGTIGFNKTEYLEREFDFLALNCQDTILQDSAVRQAIGYAIDKDHIVTSVFNNQKAVSEYPLDYGNYLYQANEASSGYNPDQARNILEENGWTYRNNRWRKNIDGRTRYLDLKISVKENDSARVQVAELIEDQLENIGISVTVDKISDNEYSNYIQEKDYQILLTGVYTSYTPDLMYYFSQGNISNYSSDTMNELMQNASILSDENQLIEAYQKIYSQYKTDMPFIGLYRNKNISISSQSVVGTITPTNYTTYTGLETWYRNS